MGKLIICILLLATVPVYAQPANLVLFVNEKAFHSGDKVSKSELKGLCTSTSELIYLNTNRKYKPVSFEWAISIANTIWKGQLPEPQNIVMCRPGHRSPSCAELLALMKSNDILFINQVKLSDRKIPLSIQFAFRLQ